MRRLLVTVAAVGLFACGCTAGPAANSPPSSGLPQSSSTGALDLAVTTPWRPDCGAIDIGSEEYGSHISADEGEPGATVAIYGPTLRGEDWAYAPGTAIEVWWNSNTPSSSGRPLDPGPVLLLGTVPTQGRCAFQMSFEVPSVAPGTYRIVVFIFFSGGFGLFGCHYFTVGAPSPPPTPPKSSLTDCAEIR